MKKILTVVAVILVLAGVGLYYVSLDLNGIVQAAIEKYGTEATKTSVRLNKVDIVLTEGLASLSGLSVKNPAGFSDEKAFYLGNISVKIDTSSLASKGPIVIKDITIEKPEILYEVNAKGENNLQTISRNAQAYASSLGLPKGDKKDKPAAAEPKKEERKLIIENLSVRDGKVGIKQPLLQDKALSATLPPIHLTNIGKNEGGATSVEVGQRLLSAITNSAAQAASASLAKELGANIGKTGGEMLDKAAPEIGGAVKGLFK